MLSISRDEYIRRFNAAVDSLKELTTSKNANYANEADAFANFRLIETLSNGRLTGEDGLHTRMSDKLQRIVNLQGGAKNNHESLVDNYRDLATYSLIGLIAEEIKAAAQQGSLKVDLLNTASVRQVADEAASTLLGGVLAGGERPWR